jgi:hypothetical protein
VSDRDLQPLDEDLAALLAVEQSRPGPPPGSKERVSQGVQLALAGLAAAGARGGGAGATGATPPVDPMSSVARYRMLVAAAFLAGGVTGGVLGVTISRLAPRAEGVSSPSPVDAHAPQPLPTPTPVPPPEPPSHPTVSAQPDPDPSAPPPAAHAKAASSASSIAAERPLLDVARAALLRGEPGEAMRPIELHARRFPNGVLAEEREALAVESLVSLHRYDEARARAATFRTRFPGSLNQGAVDAALRSIP